MEGVRVLEVKPSGCWVKGRSRTLNDLNISAPGVPLLTWYVGEGIGWGREVEGDDGPGEMSVKHSC